MAKENVILVAGGVRSLIPKLLRDEGYQVSVVPSAEQAVFELKFADFALLVVHRFLLGTDGFELVREAKKQWPKLPVLLVAERLSGKERQVGEALGVAGYLVGELGREGALTAVSTILFPSSLPVTRLPSSPAENIPLEIIRNRLATLRTSTSAAGILFARQGGEILIQDIDSSYDANLPAIVEQLHQLMSVSFTLARSVDSQSLFTLHYHALESLLLYSANVGQRYFLALLFAPDSRSGRISTVSVFAGRAIKELLPLLDETDAAARLGETSELVAEEAAAEATPPSVSDTSEKPDTSQQEVESAEPILEPPTTTPLSEAQMAQLLSLDFDKLPEGNEVEDFWSQASDEEEKGEVDGGLSFEEAMKQGLVSSELSLDDD